jgi:fatty-acyl-CoA synthase
MSASVPKGGIAPCSRRVMNLAHFLRQSAKRYPDAVGLVSGEDRWTWARLDARVDAMAAALSARGVSKGDRVLVLARNCNQLFESMFVCFRLGAIWVPTNFRLTADEVAYLARVSGATAMICGREFPEHARVATGSAPSINLVVSIGASPFGDDYETIVGEHQGRVAPDTAVEHDDPCWFFFTSGTTGRPKAAVLTHGQMGFVVTNHLCDLMPGTTHHDVSLAVAPLSHGAGIHALAQVARGAKTVLSGDRFDAEETWRLIERWRVTNIFTVPTILKILAEHPAADKYNRASLRYVIYAGAPMYREDQKRALAKFGKVLVQYFGLGEVTGNITVLPADLHDAEDRPEARIGTCGFERTGIQVSIQDESGRELPPGETGEICVCGLAVFAGYHNDPEANAKAFRNGWFRTGDLGRLDQQGFLYITGRASDMYISGGSNVYPREIEEKILTHPAVAEVAIVGVPDKLWGEVGVAVCVLRPEFKLSERDLLAWLAPKVARYKQPKRIVFWDEIPRSGYGKVSKKVIRAELEARGCLSSDEKTAAKAQTP